MSSPWNSDDEDNRFGDDKGWRGDEYPEAKYSGSNYPWENQSDSVPYYDSNGTFDYPSGKIIRFRDFTPCQGISRNKPRLLPESQLIFRAAKFVCLIVKGQHFVPAIDETAGLSSDEFLDLRSSPSASQIPSIVGGPNGTYVFCGHPSSPIAKIALEFYFGLDIDSSGTKLT